MSRSDLTAPRDGRSPPTSLRLEAASARCCKEERNLAKKRQRLMQVGEPGTKSKLSLSVANDCDRRPRICRLVTCSSCCGAPTSKTLMVDLCSDVLRIMDFPVVHEFAHVWKPSKL